MKARVTITLVAINVVAYLWEIVTGALESNQSLLAHGALYVPLVRDGQWWRIVSAAFLHGGLAHIALNMFALYQLGTFVESMVGSWRMLAIYAISLVGGGLAVVYFGSPMDVTVGASGAIFGLFGGLLAIGVRLGSRGRWLITQTLPVLVINLAFTFAVPFISKADHIGGLASGFVAGLLFFFMRRPSTSVVVDTQTGETTNADYIAPDEPNGPPRTSGIL